MGRGNWRPYQDSNLYDLRYFDLTERYGEDEIDEFSWEVFEDEILENLPGSFWRADNCGENLLYSHNGQDNLIIARNELVCVMLDAQAYAHHVGVAMVLMQDYYMEDTFVQNFGPRYLARSAPAFWRRMCGEQRVRTSAWTSAKVGA
jgi:hypothetical protein